MDIAFRLLLIFRRLSNMTSRLANFKWKCTTQSQNAPTDYDNFPTFQFYHEASHFGHIEENILQMLKVTYQNHK